MSATEDVEQAAVAVEFAIDRLRNIAQLYPSRIRAELPCIARSADLLSELVAKCEHRQAAE